MKKFFLLFGVLALLCSSCEKYLESKDDVYNFSCGIIYDENGSWYVSSDNGNRLNITEWVKGAEMSDFELSNGDRIMMAYYVTSHPLDTLYNVTLRNVTKLLTKKAVISSEITAGQMNNLGSDNIEVVNAWFGAGKYLNVMFSIKRDNFEAMHRVNLLFNVNESTADTLVFDLKHNTLSDNSFYMKNGNVSFDIVDCLPAEKNNMGVCLNWIAYDSKKYTLRGTIYKSNAMDSRDELVVENYYWTNIVEYADKHIE